MEVTKPWQGQIERALRSMQAFVAIVHPEFNQSGWCHQEAGWALGRRTPHFVVRMGADPVGFLSRDQWPSYADRSAKDVADVITSWVRELPELGDTVLEGLMSALESAGDYVSAGAAASRVAALGTLTPEQFVRVDRIWWSNDQLHNGMLATKAMQPFYAANGRAWPPAKPAATPVRATPAFHPDEEPF